MFELIIIGFIIARFSAALCISIKINPSLGKQKPMGLINSIS
jgi:hypothetical protein